MRCLVLALISSACVGTAVDPPVINDAGELADAGDSTDAGDTSDAGSCACSANEVCRAGACLWNDASLSALNVSPGSFTFAAATMAYDVTVPVVTMSIVVTATVPMPTRATIRVQGAVASSGASTMTALTSDSTSVLVEVTAESGASRTTRLTINRTTSTTLPRYVPTTVGEASVVTLTNALPDVRPMLPPGVGGAALGLGDYSGGAANRWASRWGKHLVHGGGHAAMDDGSVYAVSYEDDSVSWQRLIATPDLRVTNRWFDYGNGDNSYNYFVWRGASSTKPDMPTDRSGWAMSDDPATNPREIEPGWPGSPHSYDTLRIIPPQWANDPGGALLKHGSFAVGRVAAVDTFLAHRFRMGATTWDRLTGSMATFARSSSLDTRRGHAKPYSSRGYRDLSTGAFVTVAGSVTGLPQGYADNHWTEYHELRDVHVYCTNTEAETTAGMPSKWVWWPAGTDSGVRNAVTWAAGAPPNIATRNSTGQASLVFIDALGKLCFYTRADQDAYYLIDVPPNPADAWSWTRVPITGAGRPSLLRSRHTHIYRRWDWLPALKSISYVPLANDTGVRLDTVVLLRLVD